jgi:hypothetical protein
MITKAPTEENDVGHGKINGDGKEANHKSRNKISYEEKSKALSVTVGDANQWP